MFVAVYMRSACADQLQGSFLWVGSARRAFSSIKEQLFKAPVLAQPNFEKDREGTRSFYVYTDASRTGTTDFYTWCITCRNRPREPSGTTT